MGKTTDIRVRAAALHFLPIDNRVPLKFGTEIVTSTTCARARVRVSDQRGRTAEGWGETPLSVQWVWPSELTPAHRLQVLERFCVELARAWATFPHAGHPLEVGHDFQEAILPELVANFNRQEPVATEPMPWLAALVCCSVFDQAVHDAYGQLLQCPVYRTYTSEFISRDLGEFLRPASDAAVNFKGRYPAEFLLEPAAGRLLAWHLVGGVDPLDKSELTGAEPDDGYPVLLKDWIQRDGLQCLKVKLCGRDSAWDYNRLVKVGQIGRQHGVQWFSADFNCTVQDPEYVNVVLDRFRRDHPDLDRCLLYVEQPLPYDLPRNRIPVHSISARKPLFLDESAHDWRMVMLGRELGWSGVALKTCKTQTGAILSACWAKAHGLALMVQDLTNPMLAQIPHVLLAAHVGTIMGVETNSMQFYPEASRPEAAVHPGLYQRQNGMIDLSSIRGAGFGYRAAEIARTLPPPVAQFEG